MSKNVLLISGSPRKGGNSDLLCDEFLRGFTDCLPGAKVRGVIYGEGVYQKGEVTATKAFRDAYRMGKDS